ncbi:MAG: non-canonical purine NTP pyrophosphatase, partial [Desulfovibrionaceae bacterium]|nr:non-canonical purine NTP pyrophosphatase [Desulfovibrionaceae bacterium]
KGRLLSAPRGSNGFGYDPVFYIPELGRTVAELSREEKMAMSHRSLALKGLMRLWPEFWQRANG